MCILLQIKEPIIADAAQLIKLALDCIYTTKRFVVSPTLDVACEQALLGVGIKRRIERASPCIS